MDSTESDNKSEGVVDASRKPRIPTKVVIISITPTTHPNKAVCRGPTRGGDKGDALAQERVGDIDRIANRVSQVLGSIKPSIIYPHPNIFTLVWFSLTKGVTATHSTEVRSWEFVGKSWNRYQ